MAKKPADIATQAAAPQLDSEFANRLRDPFENAYMGVLRTNDPLLLERGHGSSELYRDLKRDGKVFGGLQKRQLALVGKPWQVEPRVKDDGARRGGALVDRENMAHGDSTTRKARRARRKPCPPSDHFCQDLISSS